MLPIIPIISGLVSVAPTIAKWIGGDKAEDAANKIANIASNITGISSTKDAVEKILSDPASQLEFIKHIENSRVEMDKIYLSDRKDARLNHRHSVFPAILCSVLTIGLFSFVAGLMFLNIPEENMRLIDTVFGSYLTSWIGSCAYWFGTTRGSADKNKFI